MDQDLLAELLVYLEDTGDVPPAWLAAHLPDGDLERIWAASGDLDALFRTAAVCAARPVLVRAGCECARTTFAYLHPAHFARVRDLLELTEAWCRGAATADAVRAAFIAIRHVDLAGDTGDGEPDVGWGYARTAVAAVADAVSFEYPADAAASAARAARDAMAMHAVTQGRRLDGLLLGNDPRWVAATDAATPRIAALVRAHLPCPTLDQLRSAFEEAGDPGS